MADDGHTIVVATDQMASMESVSADHAMVKADFIGLHWFAMWSGDDITPVPAIIRRANESLEEHGRPYQWTAHQVATALSKAYQQETLERAVAEILSPYGLDMPAFLSNGGHIFQKGYAAKLQEIDQFDLGIDFLVAGYHKVKGSIFTVERRGRIRYYDKPGFWTTGSGSSLAFGALALRRHNTTRTTQETLYAVLEAKFSAELARGVGQYTTLGVLTSSQIIRLVPKEEIAAVREIWEQYGKPPVPNDALIALHKWWRPHRDAIQKHQVEQMRAFAEANLAKQQSPQRPKRGGKRRPPSQE